MQSLQCAAADGFLPADCRTPQPEVLEEEDAKPCLLLRRLPHAEAEGDGSSPVFLPPYRRGRKECGGDRPTCKAVDAAARLCVHLGVDDGFLDDEAAAGGRRPHEVVDEGLRLCLFFSQGV